MALAKPTVHELDFIKLVSNHAEFGRKLSALAISGGKLQEHAKYICECWFKLACEHIDEANKALRANCSRAAFSRAYYAAYNASKAARYLVSGAVSLKGDDHKDAAAKLPQDLMDVAHWSQQIVTLYEHRLRADYDNWSDSTAANSLSPAQAVQLAASFIEKIRAYLNTKFGAFL